METDGEFCRYDDSTKDVTKRFMSRVVLGSVIRGIFQCPANEGLWLNSEGLRSMDFITKCDVMESTTPGADEERWKCSLEIVGIEAKLG
jgi:hypothetical protein